MKREYSTEELRGLIENAINTTTDKLISDTVDKERRLYAYLVISLLLNLLFTICIYV